MRPKAHCRAGIEEDACCVLTTTDRTRRGSLGRAADIIKRHSLRDRSTVGRLTLDQLIVVRIHVPQPLTYSQIAEGHPSFMERIGLPWWRFHDLCHSCISLLLAQGCISAGGRGTDERARFDSA